MELLPVCRCTWSCACEACNRLCHSSISCCIMTFWSSCGGAASGNEPRLDDQSCGTDCGVPGCELHGLTTTASRLRSGVGGFSLEESAMNKTKRFYKPCSIIITVTLLTSSCGKNTDFPIRVCEECRFQTKKLKTAPPLFPRCWNLPCLGAPICSTWSTASKNGGSLSGISRTGEDESGGLAPGQVFVLSFFVYILVAHTDPALRHIHRSRESNQSLYHPDMEREAMKYLYPHMPAPPPIVNGHVDCSRTPKPYQC